MSRTSIGMVITRRNSLRFWIAARPSVLTRTEVRVSADNLKFLSRIAARPRLCRRARGSPRWARTFHLCRAKTSRKWWSRKRRFREEAPGLCQGKRNRGSAARPHRHFPFGRRDRFVCERDRQKTNTAPRRKTRLHATPPKFPIPSEPVRLARRALAAAALSRCRR
jgi:hypothetical protein